MKWLIGGLAALAIGLVAAPVAGADSNDRAFIKATDKVIIGWPSAAQMAGSDIPRFLSSSGSTPPRGVRQSDAGAPSANDYIVAAFDDRREHAGYLAAWFEQISIEHYCPRHSDKIGII